MITHELQAYLQTLTGNARHADEELAWPGTSWQALAQAGVLGWSIDRAHGGSGLDLSSLLHGYERIASACLTTCFILSQRESAVRHLRTVKDIKLRDALLSPLVRGSTFATVGLSQLTTSRQHKQPTLLARESEAGFVLSGTIPWVTGAAKADHIVIGAVTDKKQQILAVLPTNLPGVRVGSPLDLMALRGSLTAEVCLDDVRLDREWLLAGPAEKVLGTGKGGAGGLETSCLAVGLAGAAIEYFAMEAQTRPDLQEGAATLEQDRCAVRAELHELARNGGTPDNIAAVRTRANSLVLRATQLALTAAKGTGFLRSHAAQRWARQALFFLVWSCPRPTTLATIATLSTSRER